MSLEKNMGEKINPEAFQEMAEIESRLWWFRGRRAIISTVLDSFSLNKNAKILEVGCGTGGNLEMLGNYGIVSAFEMNEVAHKIAIKKSKGRHDVRVGTCPNSIPFENKEFDLICMFDVLEHIPNDLDTLCQLKNYLGPNGLLFITVPAYQMLYGQHDIYLHHERRYSKSQLFRLIDRAGFEPVKITYFNTFLFPLALLIRIKNKLLKNSLSSGTGIPNVIINNIFEYLFSLEKHLLKRYNLPFGLSLLGVFYEKK